VTTAKITPPRSAMSMIARGIVRRGYIVSSVSVVTASKPRNEYAAMPAPPAMAAIVVPGFTNGAVLNHPPTPSARKTCRSESTTNAATTSIWKVIRMKVALSAIRMPTTLRIVVSTMKPTTHSQSGTSGKPCCR
jgi:hypothetical protein